MANNQLANNILKNIRLKLGLNQSEFADLVKCDPSYISNIESGAITISLKRFKGMVELAGYKVAVTVEGNGDTYTL